MTQLIWVNSMRLNVSQRNQCLFSAPPDLFAQLEAISCRHGKRLSTAECKVLNEFSVMISLKLRSDQGVVNPQCDFCDSVATHEASKQTILPFSEEHLMGNDLLQHIQHRPLLTFHDQLWSCCGSTVCRHKLEAQTFSPTVSTDNYRVCTALQTCRHCLSLGANFKCSRCKQATYCSQDCQRAAWRMHKKVCSAPE